MSKRHLIHSISLAVALPHTSRAHTAPHIACAHCPTHFHPPVASAPAASLQAVRCAATMG
eukprot:364809-Chlamydomonas_euryale.AAC.8